MIGMASNGGSRTSIHTMRDARADPHRTSRRARMVWYAVVPSAFVIMFAGLLWLDLGSQLTSSIRAAQPAVATTTQDFLHAPAGDPSLPRASNVMTPSASAEPEVVPTF